MIAATRQYRPNDPYAPKYTKGKFDLMHYGNREFYTAMKKQHPELKKYTNVQLRKFIDVYNTRIATEVINNRNGVQLPEGLGIIVTGACKLAKNTADNNIDIKLSAELGKPVTHQNLHTDQYVFKIKYSNDLDKYFFRNNYMWCFDADRKLTRKIAAEFKKTDGWKKYIVFTTKQHIAHLFKKPKLDVPKENPDKGRLLSEHNEFAF